MSIKIGLFGYGNIAKAVEKDINQYPDMELVAVFTRREPSLIEKESAAPVFSQEKACSMEGKIDVMLMCGSSVSDLPSQSPEMAGYFNIVDCFDTHAKIPGHFNKVNKAALESGKTAIISVGWDPGTFSLNRLLAQVILPRGKSYTFWGKGVSQGHSDAVRRVRGVKDAKQYTIPIDSALEAVRNGENPDFTPRNMHLRECFIVPEEGADKNEIEKTVKNMPNYFKDYDTIVHFISREEFIKNHSTIPHGGFVLRSGTTGEGNKQIIECSLKLDSNPEFTANVMLCYARAAFRLNKDGNIGCKTVFDIPPYLLFNGTQEEMRERLL
ncbi:MAG: Meso-diaminopimelate D-dehydrogenase [Firmicutes bacterium ADurb.Bin300]|jgi:diaminopimelate dehydrogenase|nr:MAG: Meso-diaminopimelate D-dehydrogenase [Firmicutes bacterium ADurb.Bin300]